MAMIKKGGLEETTQTDSVWGRPVRISTTVRKAYRKIYAGTDLGLESMRNAQLNELIAKDFINSSGRVVHYFRLGSKDDEDREWAEIRNMVKGGRGLFQFYVSAIRSGSVDVLAIQGKYIKTKFRKTPQGI
jgi:hypothetical protein